MIRALVGISPEAEALGFKKGDLSFEGARKGNFLQGEQVIRYPASNPCYKGLLRSQRARILTASSNGCSGWPSSASWRSCFSDLTQFKFHLELAPTHGLTLHFNSPSRRFRLGVIALVVIEMKRQGKLASIPLKGHHAVLALLNDRKGLLLGPSIHCTIWVPGEGVEPSWFAPRSGGILSAVCL
ncbi:MAG TPA: hypothetical protein VN203_11510 [Candidatus Acidoferrum sp.]|nr:hypothetical protein [Candidatus Acidoferrum sp.]